jgi:hypothetical protein
MLQGTTASLVASAILFGLTLSTHAASILVDDFNDGNDDGWARVVDIPASRPWSPGIFDASGGAYHLASTGVVGSGFLAGRVVSAWDRSSEPLFANGIWRMTIRLDNAGTEAGVDLRFDPQTMSGYAFGLDAPSVNPRAFFLRADNGVPATSQAVPLGFPIQAGEDWILEVGAVGDLITMKAWPASQPAPDSPQFSLIDATYSSGLFGIGASGYEGWHTSATFDDISFTPVPEPSTTVLLIFGAVLGSALGRGRGTLSPCAKPIRLANDHLVPD